MSVFFPYPNSKVRSDKESHIFRKLPLYPLRMAYCVEFHVILPLFYLVKLNADHNDQPIT
jgi:hypothetical protein